MDLLKQCPGNPETKNDVAERNEWLAQALEANEKKAVMCMRDASGGRCCLAVAEDVAVAHGLVLRPSDDPHLPNGEVGQWFGWKPCHTTELSKKLNLTNVALDNPTSKRSAAQLNDAADGKMYPHATLAKMFRNQFVTPNLGSEEPFVQP